MASIFGTGILLGARHPLQAAFAMLLPTTEARSNFRNVEVATSYIFYLLQKITILNNFRMYQHLEFHLMMNRNYFSLNRHKMFANLLLISEFSHLLMINHPKLLQSLGVLNFMCKVG